MKNLYVFILSVFASMCVFSQQRGVTYQAVIMNSKGSNVPGRDQNAVPLISKNVCLKFSFIKEGNVIVYQEKQEALTNVFGVINTIIGNGISTGLGISPDFNAIVWDAKEMKLEVAVDITGACNDFEVISNQPLNYVPFALYALDTGNPGATGPQGVNGSQGLKGDTGLTGSQGLKGDIGVTGSQGLTGNRGEIGEIGSQGLKGDIGVKGADGALNAWSLTGSAGTTPETNFIGTTDGKDFVIKTNNKENLRIMANGNIGVGIATPNASAKLDISSNAGGMLIPRMTAEERNAIASPAEALMIFNTTSKCFEIFNSNTKLWNSIYCFSNCLPPPTPTNFSASYVACTEFKLSWSSSSFTTYMDIATDPSFTTFVQGYNNLNIGTENEYLITGLSPGNTYYSRIRVVNSCGLVSNSQSVIVSLVIPIAPVVNAATAIDSYSFTANWSLVAGATAYYLDVAKDAGFTSFVTGFNNKKIGSDLKGMVTNLLCNTSYYYRVRAASTCGLSSPSDTITTQTLGTLAAPTVKLGNKDYYSGNNCTNFLASWNSDNISIYYLDVSTNSEFSSFVTGYENLNVNGYSSYGYTVSNLTKDATYYFRVRKRNTCGTSANSNTGIVKVGQSIIPIANVATNITATGFTLNWINSADINQIEIATDADFNTVIDTKDFDFYSPAGVSYIFNNNLTCNTTYYYRVRSFNFCDNNFSYSNTIRVVLAGPATPTAVEASNTNCTFFYANWSGSEGSVFYLDVATDSSFTTMVSGYNNLNTGAASGIYVKGLTAGTPYFYRVRASNSCGLTVASNPITVTTTTSLCGE